MVMMPLASLSQVLLVAREASVCSKFWTRIDRQAWTSLIRRFPQPLSPVVHLETPRLVLEHVRNMQIHHKGCMCHAVEVHVLNIFLCTIAWRNPKKQLCLVSF